MKVLWNNIYILTQKHSVNTRWPIKVIHQSKKNLQSSFPYLQYYFGVRNHNLRHKCYFMPIFVQLHNEIREGTLKVCMCYIKGKDVLKTNKGIYKQRVHH